MKDFKGIEIRLLMPETPSKTPSETPEGVSSRPSSVAGLPQEATSAASPSPNLRATTSEGAEAPSPFEIYAKHLEWLQRVSEENNRIWQKLLQEL